MGLNFGEDDYDKIDEMNAIREDNWKNSFKKQYNMLEWVYFLGDLSKRSPRFIRPFLLKKRKILIERLIANEHQRDS